MRNTNRCPKCKHDEILHVPDPMDTAYDRLAIGGSNTGWSADGNGAFEVYMCMSCGFSELYVRAPHKLDLSRLPGANVLRAAEPQGPYR